MKRKTTRGGHPEPCTCETCKAANATYERNRYRKIGYGQWDPWMAAGPVREHVTALMAAGVGLYRIADLAAVSPGALRRLLYGAPCEGKAPSARIRREAAQAILAVTAAEPGALVDATGTRRRLQALMALGWPAATLAPQVPLSPGQAQRIVSGYPQVTAATARNVRAAYDRLWCQRPPEGTRWERAIATRTRNLATREGWPVPAAWDDDLIDATAAGPGAGWKRRKFWRAEDLVAEYAELAAMHPDRCTAPERVRTQVAERLGVKRATLDKALSMTAKRAGVLAAELATQAREMGAESLAGAA